MGQWVGSQWTGWGIAASPQMFGFFGFSNGFATFVCRAVLGGATTDHYITYTRTCGQWMCLRTHGTHGFVCAHMTHM